MDCAPNGRWVFDISGDGSIAALDRWYSILCGGGCGFTDAWVREEEIMFEIWQRKIEAEEAGYG